VNTYSLYHLVLVCQTKLVEHFLCLGDIMIYMSYFNRDNRGGGRSFGRRSFGDRGGRGDRGDRQMFSATCSECGKECQVPFKPTGAKPVYCSECFEKRGGGMDSRRSGGGDRGDRRPQSNAQLEAINTKLDKILSILEPTKIKAIEVPKVEKEIEIVPEKPVVVVKKKRKTSKKKASQKESK
jgi:CxxC-x17-CxxC domain-containing protein